MGKTPLMRAFPLIKLAKKLKVTYSRLAVSLLNQFPLIKLAKKLKDGYNEGQGPEQTFPLIKLAKKLKASSSRRGSNR